MIVQPLAEGSSFRVEVLDRTSHSQDVLDATATALFEMFLERERDFATNPDVIIEYPAAVQGGQMFLADAAGYIRSRIAAHEAQGQAIGTVVVLTTYADAVDGSLHKAGFAATRIDMPAGPDHTAAYRREGLSDRAGARTLYFEAVNEADPKIRPAFALRLIDGAGRFCGGACGSLAVREGRRYCYLATMTLIEGLPAGTGQLLGARLVDDMAKRSVDRIDVGTQTADAFYRKIGFHVVHTILPDLRRRDVGAGRRISHDLAMLSLDL